MDPAHYDHKVNWITLNKWTLSLLSPMHLLIKCKGNYVHMRYFGEGELVQKKTTCFWPPRPPCTEAWDISCSASHPLGPHSCFGLFPTYFSKIGRAQGYMAEKRPSSQMQGKLFSLDLPSPFAKAFGLKNRILQGQRGWKLAPLQASIPRSKSFCKGRWKPLGIRSCDPVGLRSPCQKPFVKMTEVFGGAISGSCRPSVICGKSLLQRRQKDG